MRATILSPLRKEAFVNEHWQWMMAKSWLVEEDTQHSSLFGQLYYIQRTSRIVWHRMNASLINRCIAAVTIAYYDELPSVHLKVGGQF